MLNLNKREKKLLQILIALIAVMGLYFFLIEPVVKFKSNVDSVNQEKQERLRKFEEIYSQYRDALKEKNKLNTAVENVAGITPLVDEIAADLKIINNKVYLREKPGSVQNSFQKITTELRFEGLHIRSLLEFINRLEKSNTVLKISSMTLYAGIKEKNRYDSVITIVSFVKR